MCTCEGGGGKTDPIGCRLNALHEPHRVIDVIAGNRIDGHDNKLLW